MAAPMQQPLITQSASAPQNPMPPMMQPAPPMRPNFQPMPQQMQQPPQHQLQPQPQPQHQPQHQPQPQQYAPQQMFETEQIPEDAFELYNNIDSEVLATQAIPYQVKQDAVVQGMCNPDDIQMFAIISIVFLVVSILPIGSLVEKYIALDKIPHGDSIAKAVIAGLIVFLIVKLIRA